MKTKRLLNALLIATLLIGTLSLGGGLPVQAADRNTPVQKAVYASVFIVILDDNGDSLGSGSGSILTSDGMILSNYHVVADTDKKKLYNSKGMIAIGVLDDPTEPPVVNYLAQVVQVDPDLDLSISCIVSDLKNRPLSKNTTFPTVPIGDADQLFLGDNITVIGFPGIGFGEHGDTPSLTFSKGNVAGFESRDKLKVWIKTDAATGPGDSGAMVVNDDGEIVGVHTQGWSDPNSAARLSAERPINRAYDLIRLAQASGCRQATNNTPATPTTGDPGNASIASLAFAEGIDKNGNPVKSATAFKSGLPEVYGIFAYSNMQNGLNWSPTWLLDGKPAAANYYVWDSGSSGTYYSRLYSKSSLPDGSYRLQIVVEGKVLKSSAFTIGSTTNTKPSGSSGGVSVSGTIVDADTGKPIRNAIFLALKPGVTYYAWDGSDSDILTYALTDSRGRFQLPDLLPRGQSYTIAAGASGYNDNYEDDVAVTDKTPDSVNLDLTLQKP